MVNVSTKNGVTWCVSLPAPMGQMQLRVFDQLKMFSENNMALFYFSAVSEWIKSYDMYYFSCTQKNV